MARLAGKRLRAAVAATTVALALVIVGGIVGRPDAAPPAGGAAVTDMAAAAPLDRLEQAISRAQERLRRVPSDWRAWASLGVSYVERSRITSDPTYYPKAEQAVARSRAISPGNTDALVAGGALANARHDFAAARRHALAALAANAYDADAYAVLADAETQLGHADAATAAIERLLDLRPGLPAYARASYDLEQRGHTGEAVRLMRQALAAAVDPHDIAFCRNQLGDLALNAGDPVAAQAEYAAGLAADARSIGLRRGRARAAAASGQVADALSGYAALTRRSPTPSYLIEYAELLQAAGRGGEAERQLQLARAAHELFTANGGTDGLTGTALAVAIGQPALALREAQAEWSRRQHADVADSLAWALHLSGRDAEALGYARRAHTTGARSAAYAYHLGMIELALGDRNNARVHLSQALALNPSFSPIDAPAARRALTSLGS